LRIYEENTKYSQVVWNPGRNTIISYRVIIICSGVGARLRSLTYDAPKSLLKLDGEFRLLRIMATNYSRIVAEIGGVA